MNERREFREKRENIFFNCKGDNTLKTFFERFYVLPKEGKEWGEAEKVN